MHFLDFEAAGFNLGGKKWQVATLYGFVSVSKMQVG